MNQREPTNKTYDISSFEELMNVATKDNLEALACDLILWIGIYLEHIDGIRKMAPDETKDIPNWQVLRGRFIWTDDGRHDFNGVQIEDDDE